MHDVGTVGLQRETQPLADSAPRPGADLQDRDGFEVEGAAERPPNPERS